MIKIILLILMNILYYSPIINATDYFNLNYKVKENCGPGLIKVVVPDCDEDFELWCVKNGKICTDFGKDDKTCKSGFSFEGTDESLIELSTNPYYDVNLLCISPSQEVKFKSSKDAQSAVARYRKKVKTMAKSNLLKKFGISKELGGTKCYTRGFTSKNGEHYPFIGIEGMVEPCNVNGGDLSCCVLVSGTFFIEWDSIKPKKVGTRIKCGETSTIKKLPSKKQGVTYFDKSPSSYLYDSDEGRECCMTVMDDSFNGKLVCTPKESQETYTHTCFKTIELYKDESRDLVDSSLVYMINTQKTAWYKIITIFDDNRDKSEAQVFNWLNWLSSIGGLKYEKWFDVSSFKINEAEVSKLTLDCIKIDFWFQVIENKLRKELREAITHNDIVNKFVNLIEVITKIIETSNPMKDTSAGIAKFASNIIAAGISYDIPKLKIKQMLIRLLFSSIRSQIKGNNCHKKGQSLINKLIKLFKISGSLNHMMEVCNIDDNLEDIKDFFELTNTIFHEKELDIKEIIYEANDVYMDLMKGLPDLYKLIIEKDERAKRRAIDNIKSRKDDFDTLSPDALDDYNKAKENHVDPVKFN